MKSIAHVSFNCGRACSGTTVHGGYAPLRTSHLIQLECAVDAIDALVIPRVAQHAQPIKALPEAPETLFRDHRSQRGDDRRIGIDRRAWGATVRGP